MKKFYKAVTSFIIVFLSIIVILLFYAFIQVNFMNKDYPNLFGYTYFQVITGSMEPTIKIDDIVLIKLKSDFSKGDIVTYKNGKDYITHRIVETDGNSIIAKGDNNNSEDDKIEKNQIIGKVVYIFKDVSVWSKVFKDKKVLIPLGITVVLFLILIVYNEEENKD